jgi:hypothetical protein
MKTLRSRLFAALALFLACLGPAFGQQAEDPGADTAQQSGPQQVEQASEVLIEVLNDPESRAALIDLLKKNAAAAVADGADAPSSPADESGAENAEPATAQQENFALRIGEYTRVLVDDTGYLLEQAMRSLNGLVLVARGEIPVKWERAQEIGVQVIFVLIAAYAGFLLSQIVAKLIYPRLSVYARYGGGLARSFVLILTSVVDGITVGVGWAVGNAAALLSYGGFKAGVTLEESLALNAFFIIGVANVGLRFIFAPGAPNCGCCLSPTTARCTGTGVCGCSCTGSSTVSFWRFPLRMWPSPSCSATR